MDSGQVRWIPSRVREHDWLIPAIEAFADAHAYWHDAAESYHEPDEFRRKVDALIQATRNVTFRLQAAKASGPASFADWYEGDGGKTWRTFMKNDPQMVWLHDARTEITKRKGFGRASLALVSVIEGYFEPRKTLLKLPADIPTATIVKKAISKIPTEYRRHQAVEVVRRWEPIELPGHELLATVRHCLHVLDGLLLYASEATEGDVPDSPGDFLATVEKIRCMAITPDQIPLTFAADTGEDYELVLERRIQSPDDLNVAAKRYKPKRLRPTVSPDSVGDFARIIHEGSRTAFKKDGIVFSVAFMRSVDGAWEQFGLPVEDKRDKYMMWRLLGERALVGDFDAVVHTGEAWFARLPAEERPYIEASSQPGVKELVATAYETRDGESGRIISEILRIGPISLLGKRSESTDETLNFFDPIRRAWRSQTEPDADTDTRRRESAISEDLEP